MDYMYIVTYYDKGAREPVVTAFDNRDAAERCYEDFKDKHDVISIDCAPVFKSFEITSPFAVGDEIRITDETVDKGYYLATVLDIDSDGALWVIDECGSATVVTPDDDRHKERTGRNYRFVKLLIESMREGKA